MVNLDEVTHCYRILGLPLDATKADCRTKRNQLLQKFHPDKHPDGWQADEVSLERRVQQIQSAYTFIKDHYEMIQKVLLPLNEQRLTQKMSKRICSHWVYTDVEKLK